MISTLVVRDARAEDAEEFVRAHEAAWDAALSPIVGKRLAELAPFDDRVERFRAGFAQPPPDVGAWIAERDGTTLGVAVRVGSDLRALYVVPEAWGTGVAAALMTEAVDAIRNSGASEATLWVGAANARARRFYERTRWVASGETRTSALGPEEVRYRRTV